MRLPIVHANIAKVQGGSFNADADWVMSMT